MDIQDNAFSFSVKHRDEILSILGQMETKVLPFCAEAYRRKWWQKKQKFWITWAILWGIFDFTWEIIDLIHGKWMNALVMGFCGLWIVLWSLRNYWEAKKFENERT